MERGYGTGWHGIGVVLVVLVVVVVVGVWVGGLGQVFHAGRIL